MPLISVSCNCCGAPLKVGEEVRFVTCQFCNTQLEVKRNASTIFTEQINRIAEHAAQMAQDVEAIKLQHEIEMLDRESAAGATPPAGGSSVAGSAFGLAFCIFFAVVCFAIASAVPSAGAPGIFALVPVGMGVLALIAGVIGIAKAVSDSGQRETTLSRRDELVRRLEELKNARKAGVDANSAESQGER